MSEPHTPRAYLLIILAAACTTPSAPPEVQLRRTGHGVVHVTARDYRGAGFGVGYAYAQDNRCLLAHRVAEVNGRLSEQLGADAPVTSHVHDITYTALQSDHYYRGWFDIDAIRAGFAAGAPEVVALADGYAAGVNRLLAEQPDTPACEVAFTAELTRDDVFRMWVATAAVASGEVLAGFLPHAVPSAGVRPRQPMRPRRHLLGSNAWAIGRDASRDARSVHFYNPHFPWAGIQRLYLIHVTIPGELDVMGATLGGFPLPLAGFTADIAWGLTFSTAARWSAAEFALAGDPLRYSVDGVEEQITSETVSIPVLGEPSPRELPFFRAAERPIIDAPAFLLGWGPDTAYAVTDVNATNTRAVEQFLRMAQAADVQELRDALAAVQGVPWSYTVASDADGEVLFADISAVPGLSSDDIGRCVTSPVGQLHLPHGIVVLDGARADCTWSERMAPEDQPHTIRTDYVANSNNTYELPHADERLTGYSPVLGVEGAGLRPRAGLGLDMIADRLDGSDGLGAPGFTAELARDVFHQRRNRGAELLVDAIVADCGDNPTGQHGEDTVDLSEVCDALAQWDRRNTTQSRGAAVFRGMWMSLRELGLLASVFAVPASIDAPLTTPSGYTADPAVRTAVRAALARVAVALSERGIEPDAAWGEVNRVRGPDTDFAMPGGHGAEGVFDVNVGTGGFYGFDGWVETLGGNAPDSLFGASYLHVVTFGPDGPRAEGLLPYSQATDPSSPWYLDQLEAWSDDRWVAFPFTEDEIQADPELVEQTLVP